MGTCKRCYDDLSSSSVCSSSKLNIKDLQEADLKKTKRPTKRPAKSRFEERKQKQIQIQTTTQSINMSSEEQMQLVEHTQLVVLTAEPMDNIYPHTRAFLKLLEDVCNNNVHPLGSPCDDDFWPKFAAELSKQRRQYISSISSKLCETYCLKLLTFYRVMKDPSFDTKACFGELDIGKHFVTLDRIFGNHADKFPCIPETPTSSNSLKRSYDSGSTFSVAPGSALPLAEEIEVQQVLGAMVHDSQLNIVDLNFAQDWLKKCPWAVGVLKRERDPELRKKMILSAREQVGDLWMKKKMKNM